MATKASDYGFGVTWGDIHAYVDFLHTEYGYLLTFIDTWKPQRKGGLQRIILLVEAAPDWRKPHGRFFAQGHWPAVDYRTLPGLYLRMLHDAHERMENERQKILTETALDLLADELAGT